MPEGLSPGEVGKEISEHRAHTLNEKEDSGAEANPDLSSGLMAAAERRADRVLGWDFSFGV